MKVVVDTNIVFSVLLNPASRMGDLLMNIDNKVQFFAPELLVDEIDRYSEKLKHYSKLRPDDLRRIKFSVFQSIEFISEELIGTEKWMAAFELTRDIDEDDTPFVALSLELRGKLWTGDKKLSRGISLKMPDLFISTDELRSSLEEE